MRKGMIRFAVAILAMTSIAASHSEAAFAAVEFNPGSGVIVTTRTDPLNLGYQFQVTSLQSVTSLGYYDYQGNGFVQPHDVGLYTEAGALLAFTTVTSSDTLLGNFRYHAITPLTLSLGTYRVAGFETIEAYSFNVTGLTTAPGITYLNPAYNNSASLSFPNFLGGGASIGYFGGTLLFDGNPAGVATPLPPTLLAGFMGMGLLAGVRRLRRA